MPQHVDQAASHVCTARLLSAWVCVLLLSLFAVGVVAQSSQDPQLIDKFGKIGNDDLMARVDHFQGILLRGDSKGIVVLYGSQIAKYLNKRRIEGCNLWRQYPVDSFDFVFDDQNGETGVEFWKVSKESVPARFRPTALDYKLDQITAPFVLSTSSGLEEYCPKHFDLDWYAKFLRGNPTFRGRVVISVKKGREFQKRVNKYRTKLISLGITPKRVTYIQKRFNGERDEEYWLVPPRKK